MKRAAGIILLVILFLCAPWVARSQGYAPEVEQRDGLLIIKKDLGGSLSDYMVRYSRMRQDGAKLAIDGECMSACTIFFPYLVGNVCVTDKAKLGFHRSNRPEGTTVMLMSYPPMVVIWLMAEGITEDIKLFPDELLHAILPPCPDNLINPPKGERVD